MKKYFFDLQGIPVECNDKYSPHSSYYIRYEVDAELARLKADCEQLRKENAKYSEIIKVCCEESRIAREDNAKLQAELRDMRTYNFIIEKRPKCVGKAESALSHSDTAENEE